MLIQGGIYDSQPIPSPSLSNPWGSGDKTLKFLDDTSAQFKSGGGDGMHTSGYEESQLLNCAYASQDRILFDVKSELLDVTRRVNITNTNSNVIPRRTFISTKSVFQL